MRDSLVSERNTVRLPCASSLTDHAKGWRAVRAGESIVKTCPKCLLSKHESDFGRQRSRKDGLQAWCRKCRASWTASEAGRRSLVKAQRKYRSTEAGRETRRASSMRGYKKCMATEAGRKMRSATQARHNARHPDRHRARRLLNHAVARENIFRQPCEVCGAKKVEAHHSDYSKPLDVRWLCRMHHREHHRKVAV